MHFLGNMLNKQLHMPKPEDALKGRAEPQATAASHFVNGRDLHAPAPEGLETVFFAMGAYWAVERLFWQQPGVWITAAGYMGGYTPNPTQQEVATGMTGHAETVKVVHDPEAMPLAGLLRLFWENHDPTQLNRQGRDIGTRYRSAIFTTTDAQQDAALASRETYAQALAPVHSGKIVTEIRPAAPFYFAGEEHQQYLARNPSGTATLRGTGVPYPAAVGA
ncbi:MAG: peptide-methionine (S)-S-oxide reductase MsrA [Zhengella sp.]|uniref:peptide-methionine (S)-S-oxide reductase MsrA n=1 Tax=Zhengella sp. TaxID=2282762 RepID=UPI001D435FEF|nr:peptide-methionine (S)-S-oxide reductase MsrA [Notoacmeibacter sp.]MCC0025841.1 peptide-methionine (S)-S-oxide reductase MsrA [Brucellaceae bacterium]